jgi:hypothetical protein
LTGSGDKLRKSLPRCPADPKWVGYVFNKAKQFQKRSNEPDASACRLILITHGMLAPGFENWL